MTAKDEIINLYKPIGISSLDAINLFKENNPEYKDVAMTYVGRLDPLAEGVLVVLAGDAVYKKNEYLNLNKEYEAEVLFGFETDTYDILGLAKMSDVGSCSFEEKEAKIELKKFKGDFTFSLPPYSSYKIKGKSLFQWAREEHLGEIEIPRRTVKIYDTKFGSFWEIDKEELLKKITKKIDLVQGDFRQEEIKEQWKEIFGNIGGIGHRSYYVAEITISCSSGTYVRSIAHELGKKLGTGAILLSLKRTRVGEYT